MTQTPVPKVEELLEPLFQSIRTLGGSGTISEIDEQVAETLQLSDEVLEVPHNSESSNQSRFEYNLAWARTYLKQFGLIDNSRRGVWSLRPEARAISNVDPQSVVRQVREQQKLRREQRGDESSDEVPQEAESWRIALHRALTETLSPDGFERLVQRLLRECGFVNVEVTGKSGDGGIDGKGIARMSGLLSFHVIFQCKRYAGSVSASQVRDFRGAMVGRADKGLLITTGSFTRDAIREATRDGAPPLDLIDGEQLAVMLKDFSLGVETEEQIVEDVTVDLEWFRTL